MGIIPNTWHTFLGQPDNIEVAPAGEDGGGGTSSTTLFALNDFEFGSNGTLVTAAALNSAEQGTAWSWTQSRTPLGHTRITTAGNDNFTLPATINGSAIATNGTRRIEFNLTEGISDGLTPIYEFIIATPPLSIYRIVVTGFVRFAAVHSGGATDMDVIQVTASPYVTMQLIVGGGGTEGTGGTVHIETQVDGGQTYKSTEIPVAVNTVYAYELLWDGTTGDMALILRSADQTTLIGTSGKISNDATGDTVTAVNLQDYLTFEGGTLQFDKFSRVWGAATPFPLFPLTVPVPSTVTLVQEVAGSLVLAWVSLALAFKIERSANAGSSWTTIQSAIEANNADVRTATGTSYLYSDATVVNGSTYRYRITALIGSAASSAVTTDDVTVDNSTAPVAFDSFDEYTNASSLGDPSSAAYWAAGAGGMNVYRPGANGSVYGANGSISLVYARSLATFTANHRSQMTCTLLTPGSFGLSGVAVRCQSGAESAYGFVTDGTNWYLLAHISGTSSTLANGTHAVTSGVKVDLSASGAGASTRLTARVDTGSGFTNVSGATNIDPGIGKYIDGGAAGVAGMLFSFWTNNLATDWKGFNI